MSTAGSYTQSLPSRMTNTAHLIVGSGLEIGLRACERAEQSVSRGLA